MINQYPYRTQAKEMYLSEETLFHMENLIEEGLFGDLQNKAEKFLSDLGNTVTTRGYMEKMAKSEKKAQKRRKEYLKKHNIDLAAFERSLKEGRDINIPLKVIMKEFKEDLKHTDAVELARITYSITLIGILHSYLLFALVPLVGPVVGMMMLAIFVAPITEEIFKRLSIKKGQAPQGLIAMNLMELLQYIPMMVGMGIPALTAFLIRLMPMTMHTVNTIIHKRGDILDKHAKDFKVNTSKADKNKFKNEASKTAGLLHGIFNASLPVGLIALTTTGINQAMAKANDGSYEEEREAKAKAKAKAKGKK